MNYDFFREQIEKRHSGKLPHVSSLFKKKCHYYWLGDRSKSAPRITTECDPDAIAIDTYCYAESFLDWGKYTIKHSVFIEHNGEIISLGGGNYYIYKGRYEFNERFLFYAMKDFEKMLKDQGYLETRKQPLADSHYSRITVPKIGSRPS